MRPSDSPEQAAAATPLHDRAELAQSALENLFDVSPDAIFVTDAQGVIRGANPRAAELFGHTQAELIGQPIENLVPARFRGRHPSHRDNYNAHPRARQMGAAMNLFGLRKDGSEFPVDIMLKPLETSSGTVVLSFVRDVTEQRAAQEAARRFENLFEFSPDGIVVTDSEGLICDSNPRARELFGYTQTEFEGRSVDSLVPERFRGRHPAHRESYMAHPKARQMGAAMNLFGLRKDGTEFPV